MNKKITIRDVALKAGVSISTVHQALNDKPGAGAETKKRIRQIAEELGYQPNAIASSLKRKTQHIAVLIPSPGGNNVFYYPPLWEGLHNYLANASDMNIDCHEISYTSEAEAATDCIDYLYELHQKNKLDGLLTVGHTDATNTDKWKKIVEDGASVVLVGSASKNPDYLCCVQPNYKVIGRVMAELILSHIPSCGSIFLCCGNPAWQAHALVVRGFEEYMESCGAENIIYKDFSWDIKDASYKDMIATLSKPDIAACASVLAQSSTLLGRALKESGKAGRVFAVGSDLSDASVEYLQSGIFNNIIQKNPYAQGYLGVKTLVDYLATRKKPDDKIIYVGSEVVFRSNLTMYSKGNYRPLML